MSFSENGPPVLRQLSVRAVVDVLLHEGPTSRTELAKRTGISKQTMSDVIRTLEENGWVRAKGIIGGRVGRTAITYELSPDIGFAGGVEIGASTVRAALADVTGHIVAEHQEPTVDRNLARLVAQAGDLLRTLARTAGIDPSKIFVVAVAAPGVVDPATGGLRYAPNVDDAAALDLRARCETVFGCDVVIENDVKSALIGEAWCGAAVGIETCAFVQLGTGVGLGVMQDGKLIRGATGAAGEIAYLPLGTDPTAADSLQRGPLECAIGALGISNRYEASGGQEGLSVRAIFDRARAGEKTAMATVRETAEIVALLVVAIGAMYDPQKIIFGGGIGRDPLMVSESLQALKSRSLRSFHIETARLGHQSPVLGAIALAVNRLHNDLFTPSTLPKKRRLPPSPAPFEQNG